MKKKEKVAVCSRSFSQDPILREELLRRYTNVTFNDAGIKLEGKKLVDFLRGHDKAIIALERIEEDILAELPELKVISKYGIGLDTIDMEAMRRHGKRLGWTGGVNHRSVSELVISFAIAMLRHIPAAYREVLAGTWRQHRGGQLSNRTVGIIGCGFIGKDVAKLLQPFECRILANDIRNYKDFYSRYNIEAVSLEELLIQADVVTLHVPLDSSTRNMLTAERLSLMKPEAILINTARGGIVDEQALKNMLKEGRLSAAALDVFSVEPPMDQELLQLPNFLVTPHIGGSASEAILAMGRAAIAGLSNNELV
jgi:phosphoglycerate dehydrogenase-like enzyme